MQRLRRSNSVIRDPVRQTSEGRRLERSRSSNMGSKPWRRLRRYWKAVVFGCGCITVVLISVPREKPRKEQKPETSIFRPPSPIICPDPTSEDWVSLPTDVELSLHVVARGNTENLRTTLTSLRDACYPEASTLPLQVWALTAHAREVLPAQDGFVWDHGTYQSRTLTTAHGDVPPLEGWARMWTEPSEKEVRLVLPEGLELSKLYFLWLSTTLARYLGDGVTFEEKKIFRENVFGISLSAAGLTEVSGKPHSWDAYEAADGLHPIFHTLPGSRGTAFFGWQWGDFGAFMDTRARVLAADSSEGESLLPTPGRSAVPSWAGSLERFMAEFVHGRGLGILHPNLDGKVSFARRVQCRVEEVSKEEDEESSKQAEATNAPTLRGGEEIEEGEILVRTHKDAMKALKQPAVSTLPAYDLLFRRHPDVTHLRLLSYRFMQRLHASASRNEEMEHLWRRPEAPQPQYKDVKYLIYQPQFGMGNQLRALEAGLAVSRVLGRMLVIPDYISDNGEGLWVRYDAIWEYGFLEELVGRDKVILQKDFEDILNSGTMIIPPTKVFLADMPIKQLSGTDEYFDRLGWGELPQVPLPLANATEAGWKDLVQLEDQVLAVSAMFGMFQGWVQDSGVGNEHWHRMVKLHVSEEATWLHDFVEDSLARFRQKATEALAKRDNGRKREADIQSGTDGRWTGGAETEFMCAHIRRQDFQESCARYEEEFRSGSGREWVVEALGGGGVCWVEQDDFRKTVDVYLRRAPSQLGVSPRFVFATSDDEDFLEATKYGNDIPVFTLDDVSLPIDGTDGSGAGFASNDAPASFAGKMVTAEEVQAAMPAVDVAVCSRAALLVLNYFSTYSALIKSKAKAQPNFVRGLYWADPPALSNWWTTYFGWLHRFYRRSS